MGIGLIVFNIAFYSLLFYILVLCINLSDGDYNNAPWVKLVGGLLSIAVSGIIVGKGLRDLDGKIPISWDKLKVKIGMKKEKEIKFNNV